MESREPVEATAISSHGSLQPRQPLSQLMTAPGDVGVRIAFVSVAHVVDGCASRQATREPAGDDDVAIVDGGTCSFRFVSFRFCRLATVNRLKAYLTGMYLTPRPRSVAIKSMLSFPFFASHSLSNALYHPVCLAGWLAGCLVILTDRSFCLRLPGFLVLIVLVIHQVSEVSFLKISFLYCLPSIIFRTSSVESTREDIIADR